MHSTSNIGGRCKAKGMVSRKLHILSRLDVHGVGKLFFSANDGARVSADIYFGAVFGKNDQMSFFQEAAPR